jgi:hypothetical protein
LLDLWTAAMITCQNFPPLPMTQDVIDLVHAMADRDKMPTGLKINTKAGIELHDTSSIAGAYDKHSINEEENIDKEIYVEEDEFENEYDEMNPNDIGEILPGSKTAHEFTVLENDNNQEEAFNNNKEDEDVTESSSIHDSSDEDDDQGDQGNPTIYKLQGLEEYPNLL